MLKLDAAEARGCGRGSKFEQAVDGLSKNARRSITSDSSLDDIDRLQLREFSADHFRPAADVLPLNRYQVMLNCIWTQSNM